MADLPLGDLIRLGTADSDTSSVARFCAGVGSADEVLEESVTCAAPASVLEARVIAAAGDVVVASVTGPGMVGCA